MAHILNVRILLGCTEAEATDGLNDIFRGAAPHNGEPWVVDWAYGKVEPLPAEIVDAIADGTYEEGDFV